MGFDTAILAFVAVIGTAVAWVSEIISSMFPTAENQCKQPLFECSITPSIPIVFNLHTLLHYRE